MKKDRETFVKRRLDQVVRLIALGLSLKAIGERLCLSPSTVSTYRARAMRKFGLANNADFVRFVQRGGADGWQPGVYRVTNGSDNVRIIRGSQPQVEAWLLAQYTLAPLTADEALDLAARGITVEDARVQP